VTAAVDGAVVTAAVDGVAVDAAVVEAAAVDADASKFKMPDGPRAELTLRNWSRN
jgi:hypothetical protein